MLAAVQAVIIREMARGVLRSPAEAPLSKQSPFDGSQARTILFRSLALILAQVSKKDALIVYNPKYFSFEQYKALRCHLGISILCDLYICDFDLLFEVHYFSMLCDLHIRRPTLVEVLWEDLES